MRVGVEHDERFFSEWACGPLIVVALGDSALPNAPGALRLLPAIPLEGIA